jgi:phosphoserine phosphatase RsbU/P
MATAVISPSTQMPNVLIADDQHNVLEALRLLLKTEGYRTQMVSSPNGLLEAVEASDFDVVLLDLNYTRDTTSGREGLELLSRIQALDDSLPLVVMTAWGSMDLAIEAMRRGASDFIQKPWDNQQVLHTLQRQIERRQKLREDRREKAERKEQIGELRELHQHLFPRVLPKVPGLEIAAGTRAAREVGGDFFDVEWNGKRLAACVADVAGKGLPAALLMANLQATIKPLMTGASTPAAACTRVNSAICDVTVVGKFVSFLYAVIDPAAHTLTYSNAGHCPGMLVRHDGSLHRLTSGGAVCGHFPNWDYSEEVLPFDPGDRLVLFTDGIAECCNANEEDFGEERLAHVAAENVQLGAEALHSKLIAAVEQHCGAKFQDDATLMVIAAT